MRRLLTFAVLVALALPAASLARDQGASDGTLSVRDARGTISTTVMYAPTCGALNRMAGPRRP